MTWKFICFMHTAAPMWKMNFIEWFLFIVHYIAFSSSISYRTFQFIFLLYFDSCTIDHTHYTHSLDYRKWIVQILQYVPLVLTSILFSCNIEILFMIRLCKIREEKLFWVENKKKLKTTQFRVSVKFNSKKSWTILKTKKQTKELKYFL